MTPNEATYWKGVERETRIRLRKMIGEQLLGKLVLAIANTAIGADEKMRAEFFRGALSAVVRKYPGYPWHDHFDELLAASLAATPVPDKGITERSKE